MGVIILLNTV